MGPKPYIKVSKTLRITQISSITKTPSRTHLEESSTRTRRNCACMEEVCPISVVSVSVLYCVDSYCPHNTFTLPTNDRPATLILTRASYVKGAANINPTSLHITLVHLNVTQADVTLRDARNFETFLIISE